MVAVRRWSQRRRFAILGASSLSFSIWKMVSNPPLPKPLCPGKHIWAHNHNLGVFLQQYLGLTLGRAKHEDSEMQLGVP